MHSLQDSYHIRPISHPHSQRIDRRPKEVNSRQVSSPHQLAKAKGSDVRE